MTMHKALNRRYDIERPYVSIKEERGLASSEDGIDDSIQQLKDYIEKCGRVLITATRKHTDNTRINRTEIIRKQLYECLK